MDSSAWDGLESFRERREGEREGKRVGREKEKERKRSTVQRVTLYYARRGERESASVESRNTFACKIRTRFDSIRFDSTGEVGGRKRNRCRERKQERKKEREREMVDETRRVNLETMYRRGGRG